MLPGRVVLCSLTLVAALTGCGSGPPDGEAPAAQPTRTLAPLPTLQPRVEEEPAPAHQQGQCRLMTTREVTRLGFGKARPGSPPAFGRAGCEWELRDGIVFVHRASSVWWGQENLAEAREVLGPAMEEFRPVTRDNACDMHRRVNLELGLGGGAVAVSLRPAEEPTVLTASACRGTQMVFLEVHMDDIEAKATRRRGTSLAAQALALLAPAANA